jgi:hypothetical protein
MAWAFILREMSDGDPGRIVSSRILRRSRLRFELSRTILLAAAITAADNLFDGASRLVVIPLLVVVYLSGYEMSGSVLTSWGWLSYIIQLAVAATVSAWLSLITGRLLLHERLDISAAWRLMRGNRLRLAAISFLLTIAFYQLYVLADAAKSRIVRSIADSTSASWTMTEAMLRYAIEFPIAMFWIVLGAIVVGIVLDALEPRTASVFD